MALLDQFASGFCFEKVLSYKQSILKIARLSIICNGICFACGKASQNRINACPMKNIV